VIGVVRGLCLIYPDAGPETVESRTEGLGLVVHLAILENLAANAESVRINSYKMMGKLETSVTGSVGALCHLSPSRNGRTALEKGGVQERMMALAQKVSEIEGPHQLPGAKDDLRAPKMDRDRRGVISRNALLLSEPLLLPNKIISGVLR
jgi:hypothetical protein